MGVVGTEALEIVITVRPRRHAANDKPRSIWRDGLSEDAWRTIFRVAGYLLQAFLHIALLLLCFNCMKVADDDPGGRGSTVRSRRILRKRLGVSTSSSRPAGKPDESPERTTTTDIVELRRAAEEQVDKTLNDDASVPEDYVNGLWKDFNSLKHT